MKSVATRVCREGLSGVYEQEQGCTAGSPADGVRDDGMINTGCRRQAGSLGMPYRPRCSTWTGSRRWRGRSWRMGRLAIAVVSLLAAPADSLSQESSYRHLSERGRALFQSYVDAEIYRGLRETQRTTFESIMHALDSVGKLDLIESVTAIWGDGHPEWAEGTDQFRLSVILAHGAVPQLLGDPDFEQNRVLGVGLGHVKLPSGVVVGWQNADSVRQTGRRPTLQISWLEDDDRIGEIDIDYRENHNEHDEASNSDVRSELPDGTPHYDLHTDRYGEGLFRWWSSQ